MSYEKINDESQETMEVDGTEQIDHLDENGHGNSSATSAHTDHEMRNDNNDQHDAASQEDTDEVKDTGEVVEEGADPGSEKVVFCSSCERCRARKTKCDGNRPCSSCIAIYMKKPHKENSPEGVTAEMCDCVYRHAKRRGPVPGTTRAKNTDRPTKKKHWFDNNPIQMQIDILQGHIQAHMLRQQHELANGLTLSVYSQAALNTMQQQLGLLQQQRLMTMERRNQSTPQLPQAPTLSSLLGLPKGVKKNLHLLDPNSTEGARLKSFYTLSVDQLFLLPSAPSEEEFFSRKTSMGEQMLTPSNDQSVLNAVRFSELALGALASDNLLLALELSNATVTCLRDCLDRVVPDMSALFLITKSFFLHGLFRSFRGDISRYLKYRRVCFNLIPRMDPNTVGLPALISAISFHDSLAYMLYNASEDDLPDIDDVIPPITPDVSTKERKSTRDEKSSDMLLCNVITDWDAIASDPDNQILMQGLPMIYTNTEAPVLNRCLDALACAVRTCCDQANENSCRMIPDSTVSTGPTPTSIAVSSNQDELCSRNLVKSGYTLLQSHLSTIGSSEKNLGFQLLYLIMSSFMELGNDGDASAIGEIQVQNIIQACKIVIENPLLLFQGGPTYHMVSNAAIMLCHFMNDIHGRLKKSTINIDTSLFDEALDTFLAVRILLVAHRKKLPQILRCHGVPRPSTLRLIKDDSKNNGQEPFIDLGETFMCLCRGCQGFVLFGCSPCVAAERALAAQKLLNADLNELDADGPFYGGDMNEFDKELKDIGSEFDLDDDTLLSILGKIISS